MRVSGYGAKYRYNVVKGAVDRYREMMQKSDKGEIKLYRNRNDIKLSKRQKGGSASSWHLKGETTSTIGVAATPGGELKKTYV